MISVKFSFSPVACIIFIALFFFTAFGSFPVHAADAVPTDCDIQNESSRKAVGDCTVEFDITPKPVAAMQELNFRVVVTGASLSSAPVIDLGMPGMQMGPNRVSLKKTGEKTGGEPGASVYEGKGVIVRCPSGKRIWRATITIPETGAADFTFDVVY